MKAYFTIAHCVRAVLICLTLMLLARTTLRFSYRKLIKGRNTCRSPTREANQRPLSVPYDFRSRPYSPNDTAAAVVGYGIRWHPGKHVTEEEDAQEEEQQQESAGGSLWTMQARGKATVVVVAPSGGSPGQTQQQQQQRPLLECPGGLVDERIHVILEGPAAVVAPTNLVESAGTRSFFFHLTVYDPGTYNLHVEVISSCVKSNNSTMSPAAGSPFRVLVTGAAASRFPSKPCADYRYRHGRWLECHNTPLPCMRTGWVWVASDCYSYLYSPEEIVNAPPTWIVFAGSSVQRGSFLSLIDHILGPEAGANLTVSEFWKCWGWMDLKIGNFRASYLDFRPYADLESDSTEPLPHVQINYVRHAIHTLLSIGREGPDVFHLELPWTDNVPTAGIVPEIDYIAMVRSWLGARWRGKLLVTARKLRSGAYASKTSPRNRFQKPAIYEWIEAHPEELGSVIAVDETSLAAAAIHETIRVGRAEGMKHGWSFHYHRQCNESGMHVCSPVCDAAAQQVLNIAFDDDRRRPGGGGALKYTSTATTTTNMSPPPRRILHPPPPRSGQLCADGHEANVFRTDRTSGYRRPAAVAVTLPPFQVCLRCPKSLSPFTILPPEANENACHAFLPAAI